MAETHTPTWPAVKKWALERIEEHRASLEAPVETETEPNILRGRLAELRALLALTEEKPEVPVIDLGDSE